MKTEPVTISIKGQDQQGEDAPLVKDVLGQIRDFTELLIIVGNNISDNEKDKILWRMTGARKNSPIAFDIEPFTKSDNLNESPALPAQVVLATIEGLNDFQVSSEMPNYFNDKAIQLSSQIFKRVTNGIATTNFDASSYKELACVKITPALACTALSNIENAKPPVNYRELGSVEGAVSAIELDGFNRPIMHITARIDGQNIKCTFKDGLDRIGHYEVGEVLKGLRLRVFGMISYKDIGVIKTISVDEVHILDNDELLPDIDDILSPNFTSLTAEDYLEQMREDG